MNNMPIEHRAFKNTAVGALSFLITLCQTVALVPILLKYWGTTNYGIWLTLMAGFNLIQTLDLGHQNYVGNQLNVQYHTDLQQFQRTLGSSLYIAFSLGFIEICLTILLVATGTLSTYLSVSPELIIKHQLGLGLLLLMAMWFTFGSAGGIVVRIMMPAGMLYQSLWLGIVVRFTQFVSIVVVAVSGGSILAACLWYAIIQSLLSLFVLWYLRSKLPQFFPWWRNGQWNDGFRALNKSLVLTGNIIGMQLSNNGLLILISAIFTSTVIPSFTTLRTLTNTAGTVTSILITSLLPDMIRFHATREIEKVNSVFNVNWFISGICVNFGIILVLPIIEPIYNIWTKGYLFFNPSLFLLLLVSISLANFGAGLNLYLAGINELRSQTYITVIRTVLLFLVAYIFSGSYGILSIGIGLVTAELAASVALPILFVNRCLAEHGTQLCKRQISLAIIPPLLLLVIGIVIFIYHQRIGFVSVVMLPILLSLYYMNWKELGLVIQQRIIFLTKSIFRKLSFGIL